MIARIKNKLVRRAVIVATLPLFVVLVMALGVWVFVADFADDVAAAWRGEE